MFTFIIGDKDQHQNAKGPDTQDHDQQSQPPSGQNTRHRQGKLTFVSNKHRDNRQKDYKNEDGVHRPGNIRKKQSFDSKLDETARDDQRKVCF